MLKPAPQASCSRAVMVTASSSRQVAISGSVLAAWKPCGASSSRVARTKPVAGMADGNVVRRTFEAAVGVLGSGVTGTVSIGTIVIGPARSSQRPTRVSVLTPALLPRRATPAGASGQPPGW